MGTISKSSYIDQNSGSNQVYNRRKNVKIDKMTFILYFASGNSLTEKFFAESSLNIILTIFIKY